MKIEGARNTITQMITPGALTSENYSDRFLETIELIRQGIAVGVTSVQIREKSLPGRILFEFVRAVVRETYGRPTSVLVNERFDIAIAAEANGVHLTSRSMPVAAVRKKVPGEFLIGVSTHDLDEAVNARDGGADYVVYGPVYESPGKTDERPPKGVAALRRVCEELSPFPVVALGGIDKENFKEAVSEGAAGIAAIRLFQKRNDAGTVVRELERIS